MSWFLNLTCIMSIVPSIKSLDQQSATCPEGIHLFLTNPTDDPFSINGPLVLFEWKWNPGGSLPFSRQRDAISYLQAQLSAVVSMNLWVIPDLFIVGELRVCTWIRRSHHSPPQEDEEATTWIRDNCRLRVSLGTSWTACFFIPPLNRFQGSPMLTYTCPSPAHCMTI